MSTSADEAAAARRRRAVAFIVLAQWLGTSLWFSPSGASDGLMARLAIGAGAFGWLIAATQLGFIAGTFGFAATGWADRHPASRLFAWSSLAGALLNAAVVLPGLGYGAVWVLRFCVGVSLAGIYPLGMKMIVQWVGGRPAAALGWLVGMLTLGTAMPHGLRAAGAAWPWEAVLLASSSLALVGAALVRWLGDGPHASPLQRGPGATIGAIDALRRIFRIDGFRASAFGYFGHMWELYAFWSVLPWLCRPLGNELQQTVPFASTASLSFGVIAVGTLGCIAGGHYSRRYGSAAVAAAALAGSGSMCLLYPLIPEPAVGLRLAALFFWGFCVVADSPQFSALAAHYAPPQWLGSALVAQNGIGFLITVASILIMSSAIAAFGAAAVWVLAPGPVLGLIGLSPLLKERSRI